MVQTTRAKPTWKAPREVVGFISSDAAPVHLRHGQEKHGEGATLAQVQALLRRTVERPVTIGAQSEDGDRGRVAGAGEERCRREDRIRSADGDEGAGAATPGGS